MFRTIEGINLMKGTSDYKCEQPYLILKLAKKKTIFIYRLTVFPATTPFLLFIANIIM